MLNFVTAYQKLGIMLTYFLPHLAILVEGEMLTLSKVTRSEMGAYMCIASNGVPPTVSKRMKLQVHCKYTIPILYPIEHAG